MKKNTFYSLASLQRHIRKNGTSDYVNFRGMLFTMDEYDISGKSITYGNMKHQKTLSVTTENRYGYKKFKDAEVEIYGMVSYRNDIHYAE